MESIIKTFFIHSTMIQYFLITFDFEAIIYSNASF